MKCRECGLATRVIDSRPIADGFIVRRVHLCAEGHRFSTLEVDDLLEHTIMKHAGSERRVAGLKERARLYWRNSRIVARVAAGEKYLAVALDHGLSETMVCHIVKTHKKVPRGKLGQPITRPRPSAPSR